MENTLYLSMDRFTYKVSLVWHASFLVHFSVASTIYHVTNQNPRSKQFKYPLPYMGNTCDPKATSICKQISGQTRLTDDVSIYNPLSLFLSIKLKRTHTPLTDTPPVFTYVCMVPFILYMNIYYIYATLPPFLPRHKIYEQVFIYVFNFCGRDAFFLG